jgi:multicomponent Na+:H+ antiporter subunit D
MVIGILGAVAQTDIRRILSFTLVSHIGYMVFGIALATTAGLAGAVFYVVHHIAIQTTLFLVAGLIERQGGSTSVNRLGGLAGTSPLLAVLFFVPAMNLAGIPPLSGFIGKVGLLQAGIAAGGWLPVTVVAAGALTSLLTLLAVSRVWSRAFWRPPAESPATEDAAAAARDAGPETSPEPVGARDDGGEGSGGSGGAGTGGTRTAARRAAWARHTAVATATAPAHDGLADGGRRRRPRQPLPRVMVASTTAMVVVTLALTGVAGALYGIADRAASDLRDRGPYIEAVFDDEGGTP